uniref:Uncharacterized protein n=1 Tax=Triticum urartu TaxID=4572 RepID=A0A8R7TLB1_TRIUA
MRPLRGSAWLTKVKPNLGVCECVCVCASATVTCIWCTNKVILVFRPRKSSKRVYSLGSGKYKRQKLPSSTKTKNFQKYKGKDGEVGLLTTVVVEPWRVDELLQSHELRNRRAGCLS